MRVIVGTLTALGFALAAPLAPAAAQAQASVGMAIVDANGGAVGTVTAVKGDNLTVKTDKHEVLLPKASFTVADSKLLFGMTQAELNAEVEKSLAAAAASVVAGASVKAADGVAVGTIDALDAETVTIALLQSGQKIQLPRTGVLGNADGTVTIGLTAEQLQAQLQASSTESTGQ